MRKKLNELINREAFKMRDLAFGPTVVIASVMPKVLIVIVALIVLFAIIKIVKISRNKRK